VFSLPEVEEVQFHGLAFVSNDSTSLLISCSDGTVHAVDTREARYVDIHSSAHDITLVYDCFPIGKDAQSISCIQRVSNVLIFIQSMLIIL
jgi:hypothetical protein